MPVPAEEQAPDAETAAVVRRSRVLVVTVIAASATLLLGAILAIVMLSSGLLAAIDKSDDAAPVPIVEVPKPAAEPHDDAHAREQAYEPPVRSAGDECGTLCSTLEDEVGDQAGEWQLELAWADAGAEVGAQDAASAVFSSSLGRGTFSVLQFETDADAAEAALRLRQRLGEPSYQIELFEDGTGVRYDYVGALVSRVVWHPDDASDEHVPGRLYVVEAPTADTPDFSTQPAFLLFLALPI